MSDGSVSAITAVIFIYSACLFLAVLMYKAVEKLLPEKLKSLGFDFTKTCFICAYPFGHGILWKYYGGIGFLCGLIPIVLLTNLLLPKGNPTPVSVWIQHFRGLLSLRSCLHRTALHLSAALAAYRLGILLFRTGLHEHFITKIKDHESGFCNSALNVSVSQGLFIETVGILYEAWFSTLKLSDDGFTDALLKITNTGLVVVSGNTCNLVNGIQ